MAEIATEATGGGGGGGGAGKEASIIIVRLQCTFPDDYMQLQIMHEVHAPPSGPFSATHSGGPATSTSYSSSESCKNKGDKLVSSCWGSKECSS